MDVQTALWWFAVGAIACNVATIVLIGAWDTPTQNGWLIRLVRSHGIKAAAILTTAATVGSLYLSEVENFVPCRYCWFQRVAMYSMAVILIVAWIARDRGVRKYAIVLSLIGLGFSVWHYLVQRFPDLESTGSCDIDNPCTLTLTWKFRFISIPYMAGSVFALVLVLLLIGARLDRREQKASETMVPKDTGIS